MKFTKLLSATALTSAALVFSNTASAQTAASPTPTQAAAGQDEQEDEEQIDSQGRPTAEGEITVVGSRLRRSTFNNADPIQVITREESTQAGFSTTAEVLQSIAVTGGTSQINNSFGGFVTQGGPGANTVSLRGVGATRTLAVLNNRRLSPAGSRGSVGSVDLNVIPNAMIERIEVLNAGASSIYGSDAVAGVINVVTRSRINGLEMDAQVNVNEIGAGNTYRMALLGGATGDRFNISGSVEYTKRDAIALGDVDFTACQTSFRRTNATAAPGSADFIDPRTGEPKCYPTGVTGENGVTVNTIGTPAFGGGLVTRAPGVPAGYTGNCDRFRPLAGAAGAVAGYECVGGGTLNLNIRDTFPSTLLNSDLVSPTEVYTGFAQGDYALETLGSAKLYFEVLATRRKSEQTGNRQLSYDLPFGSPLIPAGLRFATPFLPAQAGGITGTNPIGIRGFINYGNVKSSQEVDFVRGVVGLRGNLGFSWEYDVYAMKSWSDAEYLSNNIITSRIAQSVDVVATANGGFACRNPIGGCVPGPVLTPAVVGGELPQAWRNFIAEDNRGTTKYRETVFSGLINGPLFRLPGGSVQAAVGLEYRENSIDDTPSIESQTQNLYGFSSSAITRGSDSVFEAFGEIEAPILADIPFAYALTLNASGRYTNYESYGNDFTYKVGAVYSPIRELSFRGSYGTSFRAPALFEQFLGATSGFLSQNGDPCNNFGALDATSNRFQNCQSLGLVPDFRATSSIQNNQRGGAETGLASETSRTYTFGAIVQPDFGSFGRLSLAADYFNLEVNNGVAQLGAGTILAQCYDSPTADFAAQVDTCSLISRATTAPFALTVTSGFVNVSTVNVSGIDFVGRYTVPIAGGQFRLGASVTKFEDRFSRTLPTDPIRNSIGTLNNPEWTGSFDAGFRYDRFDFRYGVEWIDGTKTTAEFLGTTQAVLDTYIFEADDYFIHSASVRYTGDDFGLTVGVRNLNNQDLPQISSGSYNRVGNVPLYSGYDYKGRTFFVNVTSRF